MVVVAGGGGRAQLWWGSLAALLMLLCYTIAPSRLAPSVLLDSETPQDHSGLLGQLSRVALELWDGTMADASGKSPKSPSLQQADAGMRSSAAASARRLGEGAPDRGGAKKPGRFHVRDFHQYRNTEHFWSRRFDKTNPDLQNRSPAVDVRPERTHPAGIDFLRRAGLNVGDSKSSWGIADRAVPADREGVFQLGLRAQSSQSGLQGNSWLRLPQWHSRAVASPAARRDARHHSRSLPGVATDSWPWASAKRSSTSLDADGHRRLGQRRLQRDLARPWLSGAETHPVRIGDGVRRLYRRAALAEAAKAKADVGARRVARQLITLEDKVAALRAVEAARAGRVSRGGRGMLSGQGAGAAANSGPGAGAAAQGQRAYLGHLNKQDAAKVGAVGAGGATLIVEAADNGVFPLGPARFVVTTAGGGRGVFPYESVIRGGVNQVGLKFTAPVTGSFPLDATTVFPLPHGQAARFPVLARAEGGVTLRVLAPNDGLFPAGGGTVQVEDAVGVVATFRYGSAHAAEDNEGGGGGLLLTAIAGESFPHDASFVGPGDPTVGSDDGDAWAEESGVGVPVTWEAADRTRLKATAYSDGSFLPGPASLLLKLKSGGVLKWDYASASVSAENRLGSPPGMVFVAKQGSPFPRGVIAIRAVKPGEPYPVAAVSLAGHSMKLLASPSAFARGGGLVTVLLQGGTKLAFRYVGAEPAGSGGQGGSVRLTAAPGVSFPADAMFAGLGAATEDKASGDGKDAAAQARDAHGACAVAEKYRGRTGAGTVTVSYITSQGAPTPYQAGHACTGARLYVDDDTTLQEVPSALQGQTLIRTANADSVLTSAGDAFSFSLAAPATLYLLWDLFGMAGGGTAAAPGMGVLPRWVSEAFVDTGLQVATSEGPRGVLVSVAARRGIVHLGGCDAEPSWGAAHNYAVVVAPAGSSLAWARPKGGVGDVAVLGAGASDGLGGGARVVWEGPRRTSIRVALSAGVEFPGGPAAVVVERSDGGESVLQYATARRVVADFQGPGGWLLTLPCCTEVFPSGARSAKPAGERVVRVGPGGEWVQVEGALSAVPPGAGLARWWGQKGPASGGVVPYASVEAVPGTAGEVRLRARAGARFPANALFVSPLRNAGWGPPGGWGARRDLEQTAGGNRDSLVVTEARVEGGGAVKVGVAEEGARAYADSDAVFGPLPAGAAGLVLVSPPITRLGRTKPLSFHVSEPCWVYVLRPRTATGGHRGGETLPEWLAQDFTLERGWLMRVERDSGGDGAVPLDVFKSRAPLAGDVHLGPDEVPGGGGGYLVLLRPLPWASTSPPATKDRENDGALEIQGGQGSTAAPPPSEHRNAGMQVRETGLRGRGGRVLASLEANAEALGQTCGTRTEAARCVDAVEQCLAPVLGAAESGAEWASAGRSHAEHAAACKCLEPPGSSLALCAPRCSAVVRGAFEADALRSTGKGLLC